MTDAELVHLCQNGDASAFNTLAARWEGSLYRLALRTLGDADEAKDVCQEALIKAWNNISRLRDDSKFKSWVHHIVMNLCRDRFRKTKSRGTSLSLDDPDTFLAGELSLGEADSADVSAQSQSLGTALEAVLGSLPDEQRTCLVLREAHGFTSAEIADIVGVPAGTVRTRIYYGLKKVREAMRRTGLAQELQ